MKLPATDALFIGVSTKMYMGYAQSLEWLEQLVAEVDARPALVAGRVVPFVIPSFPVLPEAARLLEGTPCVLGAKTVAGPMVLGRARFRRRCWGGNSVSVS